MTLKLFILILVIYNISPIICEEASFPVNIQFHWIKNKGYYFETYFLANWFRANDFCISHGMELATVENVQERDFVISKISEMVAIDPEQPKHPTRTFWLGGNNLAKANLFTWQSSGKQINPALWGKGEPNSPNEEQCVNIWWSDVFKQYKLNDDLCKSNYYFVCQVSKCVM